jgi:hypothetical protein
MPYQAFNSPWEQAEYGCCAATRFLDVGSGCGVLTACGAVLVGRGGCAVGIDSRPAAVDMCIASVRRLTAASPAFASKAAPVTFHVHNVFMPAAEHLVRRAASHSKLETITTHRERHASSKVGLFQSEAVSAVTVCCHKVCDLDAAIATRSCTRLCTARHAAVGSRLLQCIAPFVIILGMLNLSGLICTCRDGTTGSMSAQAARRSTWAA